MKINLTKKCGEADTLIVAGWEGTDLKKKIAGLDPAWQEALAAYISGIEYKWESGKLKGIFVAEAARKILCLGLGKDKTLAGVRKAFGKVVPTLSGNESKKIDILFDPVFDAGEGSDIVSVVSEALYMGAYSFQKYKSEPKPLKVDTITLVTKKAGKDLETALKSGEAIAEAVAATRDLVNEPAIYMTPEKMAEFAVEAGKKWGFEVEVHDENFIREQKMEAFWAVAKGSDLPPRLIIMRYQGNPGSEDIPLGLVGKGLTYDSGGYAIKPADGMVTMKDDMGGGGAVIGAMIAIASQKQKTNVTAIVGACENMVSGHAYRNGDIIGSMAGKTIEVINTDAEGRLTLIDTVYYAIHREKVKKVVDICTLTGACVIALGAHRAGVLSNNEEFFSDLQKASDLSGEKIWRMPHDDEYKEQIKSEIADLKNTGGRAAGTITAGLFIREFVGETPWNHIDIAATAYSDKEGATGYGVRLLYHLAKTCE